MCFPVVEVQMIGIRNEVDYDTSAIGGCDSEALPRIKIVA